MTTGIQAPEGGPSADAIDDLMALADRIEEARGRAINIDPVAASALRAVLATNAALAREAWEWSKALEAHLKAAPSPAEGDRQWNVPGSTHPERHFAEWLNDQRMKSVSEVFHDIVRRYREALDSPVQPKGTPVAWLRDQRGAFEGPQTLDPMLILGSAHPGVGLHGATYSPVYDGPVPAPAPVAGELNALDALAELCGMATGGWDLPPSAVERIGALARKARTLRDPSAYDRGVIAGLRQAAAICADREDMAADQIKAEIEACIGASQSSAVAHATEYDQVLSEMDGTGCPRCLGSGSVPAMSNGGPDAHEINVDCHHCGGTGSARDAYLKLAEFYSKANSELTQLRYYRWFNEQEKAKQAEKLEAAQQHAYAEGRKDEAESRQPGVEDYASGFRDGWIDCRRTMAGLVEPDSAVIAMSIRGNWNPSLGPDPDRPACQRCNGTGEVNEGDPEIWNAYFDCPACSQPPKPAFVVPVQHTEAQR